VKQLRRRMAGFGPAAEELGGTGAVFEARFRESIENDLHLPGVVAIVNELVSSPGVPDGEKYALLAAWDSVLGLDLQREARSAWEPSSEVQALVAERDAARDARDYATSDRIRDELARLGLEVMDTPQGTKVRPRDQ
jgi:cysteinyl-tRNA synthetase